MSIKMRMPPLTSVRGQTLLTDNKPYLFRQSPIESQMLEDMIVGGTVAVNQLVQNGDFSDGTNHITTSNATIEIVSDGSLKVTASSNFGAVVFGTTYADRVPRTQGHRYLMTVVAKGNAGGERLGINDAVGFNGWLTQSLTTSFERYSAITTANATVVNAINIFTYSASSVFFVKSFATIDLTQMFGSTIADYVYTLEQGHAGDGIAWLKSYGFFNKDFFPFDSGSLLSVKTSGHKTVKGGITRTYPLSDIELRGIPKLTDGQIVYDGDTYASDGTVTRKYGIVDLGTLNYTRYTSGGVAYFMTSSLAGSIYARVATEMPNIICPRYVAINQQYASQLQNKTMFCLANGNVYFRDDTYSDAPSFKTAMNGVYLVYELATPTTETTDAFENPQISGTTEEYIDTRTVPMPVGHTTEYFNMIQKEQIQMHMGQAQAIKMHMPKGD